MPLRRPRQEHFRTKRANDFRVLSWATKKKCTHLEDLFRAAAPSAASRLPEISACSAPVVWLCRTARRKQRSCQTRRELARAVCLSVCGVPAGEVLTGVQLLSSEAWRTGFWRPEMHEFVLLSGKGSDLKTWRISSTA